tara:strand:+ start:1262 stop:1411 length:150 start_codon:yes stop_codon:yes gene_type:complete
VFFSEPFRAGENGKEQLSYLYPLALIAIGRGKRKRTRNKTNNQYLKNNH